MSDDDWENFAEDDNYDVVIKKDGDFQDEQQLKIKENEEEQKPLPKKTNEPKGKQKKDLQKKQNDDDEDDILGDKKAFNERLQIMARKANQEDVAKMFENDISDDLKKAVSEIKIEDQEQYGQTGYLLAKEFNKEKDHDINDIQNFIEEFFDKLGERFAAKDYQAVNKKLQAKIHEKQKEEKNAQKKGGKQQAVKVKVVPEKLQQDDSDSASDYGDDDFM